MGHPGGSITSRNTISGEAHYLYETKSFTGSMFGHTCVCLVQYLHSFKTEQRVSTQILTAYRSLTYEQIRFCAITSRITRTAVSEQGAAWVFRPGPNASHDRRMHSRRIVRSAADTYSTIHWHSAFQPDRQRRPARDIHSRRHGYATHDLPMARER